MRKPILAGNWKMNKSPAEAVEFVKALHPQVATYPSVETVVCPPFVALPAVVEALRGAPVGVGAQNLHWAESGAYTGEVSGAMLANWVEYVIIGHSERRQLFGETEDTVNRRIRAALPVGLIPVMCVGETEKERDAGQTFSVLDKQVRKGLKNLVANELGTLVIAYEPVWAIGTGKTATKEQAQTAHQFIRSLVSNLFSTELAAAMRILYGGSVKPENISELMAMDDIDGALVGGASLNPESFGKIVCY